MQYAVQITTVTEHVNPNKARHDKPWERTHILPAISKPDANDIVHAFKVNAVNHHNDGEFITERRCCVVACIRTLRGMVYLDTHTLHQIAAEYTAPHAIAAE